jgi:hypothetical protein
LGELGEMFQFNILGLGRSFVEERTHKINIKKNSEDSLDMQKKQIQKRRKVDNILERKNEG